MAQNSLTPYLGIWRDQSQPPSRSLVITLSSYQALSLLALVTTVIAYGQTRWWIITRYLLIRICWPNSLDDSEDPGSPRHLSQAKAIKLFIFRRKRQDNDSMIPIPPWFGAASLFNVLLFVVLGTIIPYYLAGGGRPAKVRSQNTDTCHGVETYSASTMSLAKTLYTQCLLKHSANEATCAYATRIVDSGPKLNFTLDPQCPFQNGNCFFFRPEIHGPFPFPDGFGSSYNKALKIAYLDMRPSDYGLNIDSRIRQSYSLTCAPIIVRSFRVPYSYSTPGNNMTVFWIGYSRFNESQKYPSIGETVRYYYPTLVYPSIKLDSIALYELNLYPNSLDYQSGWVYENYHPGLNRDDGDVLIVRFKYDYKNFFGTPFYNRVFEPRDPVIPRYSAQTTALACSEQYRLCFGEKCVGWANETAAMSQMYQLLQSKYDDDVASEALKVHGLLMKASSVRSFLAYYNRSPTMMRSIVPQYPEAEKFFGNSSNQWHWEVRSWLEMSFLAAKLGLQDSFQGVKKDSDSPGDRFSNTSWICDKVLFLDENSTNVDFVGLMATFSGFLMLWLISLLDRILDLIKRAFRICRKVCRFIGTACQRLWNILFYGLKSAVKWILPVYEFVVRKLREVFPATLSSTQQSRQSDYDDEEIPSGASFRLENLSRNS